MNKKLMAVAVAGALSAPGLALAQASTVQIYGTLIMNYNYLDAGAGRLKTDMFNSHDSNLGFKGEESLGGGLAAWFQCESTMDPTGASAAAAPAPGPAASWCGRNSAFGMKGNFGNIYAGNWDTPMKIVMANFRPFSTAGAFGVTSLWNGTQSDINNAGASFTRRQNNMWTYATPTMSGFQGFLAATASNEATSQTTATVGSKPRLWSAGLQYSNGPLILGAGYETHKNFNPAALATPYTGGTDRGWSLGAAYTFMGTLKASAMYTRNAYQLAGNTANTAGDANANAWGAYLDWAFAGPHRVRAGYTHQGDTSGSAGSITPINVGVFVANGGAGQTATTLYSLQYAYNFSKRTEVNLGYSSVHNSNVSNTPLQTLGAKPLNGENQSAIVLGVKHSF